MHATKTLGFHFLVHCFSICGPWRPAGLINRGFEDKTVIPSVIILSKNKEKKVFPEIQEANFLCCGMFPKALKLLAVIANIVTLLLYDYYRMVS
jgi:hypothetical protein